MEDATTLEVHQRLAVAPHHPASGVPALCPNRTLAHLQGKRALPYPIGS
jgi:hypothetical protein